jgi:hypothetical protein
MGDEETANRWKTARAGEYGGGFRVVFFDTAESWALGLFPFWEETVLGY